MRCVSLGTISSRSIGVFSIAEAASICFCILDSSIGYAYRYSNFSGIGPKIKAAVVYWNRYFVHVVPCSGVKLSAQRE
jgi:hypothetical protein